MTRAFGTIMVLLTASVSASAAPTDWIRAQLDDAVQRHCGQEASAAYGTLQRLEGVSLPENGKVVVVNIAAGIVTAYEDGVPVIESRAVVGQPDTPTPEMSTHVTFVRPNPTWTVPQSIISRKGWRDRLASDPSFFEDNGFDVQIGGQLLSPWEAAAQSSSVETFVQRPGPGNALGLIKIGLHNSDAIYIHDTNDPGRFESEVRSASAGCVRVEQVRELAAWILGRSVWDMNDLVDGGVTDNLLPPENVEVIMGYWTAWPDATGAVRFYPDIYGWDEPARQCSSQRREYEPTPERNTTGSGGAVWTEYVTR